MTELMCLMIACVTMAVVIVTQSAMFIFERRVWRKERQDLLNRIMSRDFGQYVSGHVAIAEAKHKTKPTPEQIFDYIQGQEDDVLPVG